MHTFEIPGHPKVQKQTRVNNGRFYDPSHKDRLYIQQIAECNKPDHIFTKATEMHLTFFRGVPKSASKALREKMLNHVILPITRPDVDNNAYLVTNALKSIIYFDDSLITDLHIYKRYAETPHTLVNVKEITNED